MPSFLSLSESCDLVGQTSLVAQSATLLDEGYHGLSDASPTRTALRFIPIDVSIFQLVPFHRDRSEIRTMSLTNAT